MGNAVQGSLEEVGRRGVKERAGLVSGRQKKKTTMVKSRGVPGGHRLRLVGGGCKHEGGEAGGGRDPV